MDSSLLKELSKQGHILPSVTINVSRSGIVIGGMSSSARSCNPPTSYSRWPIFLPFGWLVMFRNRSPAMCSVGQHVEIHVPALGDKSFDGLIIFVADTVDPVTRTVMVRTMVENRQRKLKPDMLANMHITDTLHKSLVVPEQAVVREANRDYVFLAQR